MRLSHNERAVLNGRRVGKKHHEIAADVNLSTKDVGRIAHRLIQMGLLPRSPCGRKRKIAADPTNLDNPTTTMIIRRVRAGDSHRIIAKALGVHQTQVTDLVDMIRTIHGANVLQSPYVNLRQASEAVGVPRKELSRLIQRHHLEIQKTGPFYLFTNEDIRQLKALVRKQRQR